MAEGLLRHRFAARGIDARVSSAGLLYDGREATDTGVQVMAERGIDTSGHRSRRIEPGLLGVDLVIGMAREHVREAVMLRPEIFPRTFTLKELARRSVEVGARPAGQPIGEWIELLSAGREPRDLLGSAEDDDVADPIGSGLATYQETAAEIDELLAEFVAEAWPPL